MENLSGFVNSIVKTGIFDIGIKDIIYLCCIVALVIVNYLLIYEVKILKFKNQELLEEISEIYKNDENHREDK